MKRKLFTTLVSFTLCICLILSTGIGAAAELSAVDIIGIISGASTGSTDSINLSQVFSAYLQSAIEEEQEESIIDKFVQNIKNNINGVDTDTSDGEEEVEIVLDEGATVTVAELFNVTVNELKKGNTGFTQIQNYSITEENSSTMAMFSGVLTSLVESIIGTKDIFAGAIDGVERETSVTTRFESGNDVINNLPVSGKDYVSAITADDIKDYSLTFRTKNSKVTSYTIHIDLVDVEGSAAQSGLANVFDTTDKAYATLEFGTTSINLQVKLKYTNNYVEVKVDRNGNISSYTTNMGITFLFQQEDGSYSPEMPYFGINFEEEGIVYTVNTEYTSFDFDTRLMGDADNDGKVNSTDARLVLRYSAQLEDFDETTLLYCDVTCDDAVNAADAREILRSSAKLVELPTTEEALGITAYERDDATQQQIDDLLVLMVAYQAAADAEEQKALQDAYNEKYNSDSTQEEATTGELNTSNKVEDVIDFIGSFIGDLS